jgi:hypothetical protein
VVSHDEGQNFANSIGFEFCEVSALQMKNLEVPFKTLAEMYFAKYNDWMPEICESLMKKTF